MIDPNPPEGGAAPQPQPQAAATAQRATTEKAPPVITSKLGLKLKLLSRGEKPGEVIAKRPDGGVRAYAIADLRCEGGVAALQAEIAKLA